MPSDLRLRIVRAVERGSSIRAAARRFAVSPSAAIKLMQRVRATGSAAPERYGGHRQPSSQTWRGDFGRWASSTYDDKGNVTSIGSLDYTWHWRKRLASAQNPLSHVRLLS